MLARRLCGFDQFLDPARIGYDSLMPLLDIRNLHIAFGASEAVRGISLQLEEGEVLGLVGESGSGKSVTALAILGLLGPAAKVSGQILWQPSKAAAQWTVNSGQRTVCYPGNAEGRDTATGQ